METIAVARDGKSVASRLRFDLDLPSEACDDQVIGEGILLPEWDWKRATLVRDHCRVVPMEATDTEPCELPLRLKRTARRLRAQFEQLRPARSGPVFSVLEDGSLHMRYTARTRSIEWSPAPVTLAAVEALNDFLDSTSDYIYRATLQPGQGLISNNVLHDRSGFDEDDEHIRQLYRLRYYQRIADT